MELYDIIGLLGYPLVGYLAYRGGKIEGMIDMIQTLAERGMIDLDADPNEEINN